VKLCLGKAQHSTGSPCRAPIQGTQDSPEAATIDFWNALASAPASCLHKLVPIDNLQDAFLHGVHNFSWSVSHCLRSVGFRVQGLGFRV